MWFDKEHDREDVQLYYVPRQEHALGILTTSPRKAWEVHELDEEAGD
jgi:hypothetical protein